MLVGRWWVEHGLESDGWRAGRKVQQDPRPDWIAYLKRGAATIYGAADMGRER